MFFLSLSFLRLWFCVFLSVFRSSSLSFMPNQNVLIFYILKSNVACVIKTLLTIMVGLTWFNIHFHCYLILEILAFFKHNIRKTSFQNNYIKWQQKVFEKKKDFGISICTVFVSFSQPSSRRWNVWQKKKDEMKI